MNWCHDLQNTPSSARFVRFRPLLVALFLLVFLPDWGLSCNFTNYEYMTTTYEDRIKDLSEYLPLDYPVSVISNLQSDGWCSELWRLHFMREELIRMARIAGWRLKPWIDNVKIELFLFDDCTLTVSTNCQAVQHMNVSEFLNQLTNVMKELHSKIQNDFSNCSTILCMPDKTATGAPTLRPISMSSAPVTNSSTETQPNSKYAMTSMPSVQALPQESPTDDPKKNKRVRLWLCAPVCCTFVITLIVGCILLRPRNNQFSSSSEMMPNLNSDELRPGR